MDKFDPKMMQDLMGSLMGKTGGDPIQQFKMFLKLGQPEMLNTLLDQQDMLKFGPDFLALACIEGSKDGVKSCLDRNVDILSPPESVQHVEDYRKSPFVILAAKSGDTAAFQCVLDNGGSIGDCGFIGLTKKRKNQIVSNVIGCAAYHGQNKLLKYAANRLGKDYLDLPAIEQADAGKESNFKKEMSRYTPLMLASAGTDENLDCVKSLLQFGANFESLDEFGNNVLHIAAMNGNNKIIDYLSKNLKIGIFARNKDGESALSICEALKNDEGTKTLQKYMEEYDTSKNKAQLLLEQLEREEKMGEESKDKKKAKKWRNKVNKISKAEGISVEEVEKRLAQEDVNKKNAAANQIILEAQKEKQAELDEIKRREENRKLREQIKRQEEQEYAQERMRLQKEDQMAQQDAKRAKEAQKEKYRAEARLKREKEQAKYEQSKPENGQGAAAQKRERVKSNVRPTENNVDSRTPRYQQNGAAQQADRLKSKSKSIRRADSQAADNKLTEEVKADRVVFGLGGELAMQAAHSKKAQQRMKKHMKQEEEEQKKQEELMQQKASEKMELKKAKEEEERKQIAEERKVVRLNKQKEAQAKKDAAEKSKPKEEKPASEKNAQAEKPDLKKKKEKPNTPKAEKKEKPEKVEKVYRPKTAAPEAPKEELKVEEVQKVAEQKPKAAESLKKVKAPKTEEKVMESPKVTAASETTSKSAKKTEEPKVDKQQADKKQKQDKKYQKKEKSEKSVEEQKTAVTQEVKPVSVSSKSSVNRLVVGAGSSSEIESLQKLLLAKEKEIGGLKRHIDKQDKKLDEQSKQNQQMKADLETQAKSDTLKKSIADLNDKLRKQTALNRLQASQILEFEQALWQAAKQKEEAEERMYDYIQNNTSGSAPNPAGGDDDLLQSTNQDLRIKSVQIRELQLSVDSYQGKATAINGFSKTQLTDLHEELAGTMFKVKVAMENLVKK